MMQVEPKTSTDEPLSTDENNSHRHGTTNENLKSTYATGYTDDIVSSNVASFPFHHSRLLSADKYVTTMEENSVVKDVEQSKGKKVIEKEEDTRGRKGNKRRRTISEFSEKTKGNRIKSDTPEQKEINSSKRSPVRRSKRIEKKNNKN